MIGKSYSAVVQWQVAVQAPPALKAIIVRSANDDVYTEWVYPGGCLRPYMFDTYSSVMNACNFAPPDPDVVGERWREIWQERLDASRPWGLGYLENPLQGPYWKSRSLSADYDRVRCAVFVVSGWSDCYPTALLRAFSKLEVPKRALVGPWGHWYAEEKRAVPGPRIDGRLEYLKWFDHWLKEIDNGVMDEPAVTIFTKTYQRPAARMDISEPGHWRSEREWPIARTEYRRLYFLDQGALGATPSDNETSHDEYCYDPAVGVTSGMHWGGGLMPWGTPVDQRLDEALSLVFTTPPLEDALDVTGNPEAKLCISSTAEVAYFRVKLIDVAPDGTSKLVRYGGLNATHRNGDERPKPLEVGKIYEIRVPLKSMSYVFQPGHRIRVAIASADFQNAWPTGQPAVNRLYRNRDQQSHIVLPVVPGSNDVPKVPDFKPLPNADPADLSTPAEYSVTQDLVRGTTTVRMGHQEMSSGTKGAESETVDELFQSSSFTVSPESPADAEMKARAVYDFHRQPCKVRVETDEVTTSDAENFHHETTVNIELDGKLFFRRTWSTTVPRELN
jgi:putative CocE/NonD family hydrolase